MLRLLSPFVVNHKVFLCEQGPKFIKNGLHANILILLMGPRLQVVRLGYSRTPLQWERPLHCTSYWQSLGLKVLMHGRGTGGIDFRHIVGGCTSAERLILDWCCTSHPSCRTPWVARVCLDFLYIKLTNVPAKLHELHRAASTAQSYAHSVNCGALISTILYPCVCTVSGHWSRGHSASISANIEQKWLILRAQIKKEFPKTEGAVVVLLIGQFSSTCSE